MLRERRSRRGTNGASPMAIAYADIPLAKLIRGGERPSPGAAGDHVDLLDNADGAALRAYLGRTERESSANFGAHIQQWRRTSTATARCLAWREGGLAAAAGPATPVDLPLSLPDHEPARIVRDWAEGYLSR